MEANRINITKEKSPTVIFTNRGNPFTSDIEVGGKGQLSAELEVVGQSLSMDDNGNEVMKYTLAVVKAETFKPQVARI